MRTKTILAGLILTAGLGLAGSASAQGIQIGPGGVRVDPGYGDRDRDRGPRSRGDVELSRGEALRIARRQGLIDVDSFDRRGARIVVNGSDRREEDITVIIDSRTGDVIDVRR